MKKNFYIIASIKIKKPILIKPSRWFDYGHGEIILWNPDNSPEKYGFYPNHFSRVLFSQIKPLKSHIHKENSFSHTLTNWKMWRINQDEYITVKKYINQVEKKSSSGELKYHPVHFTCLDFLLNCLRICSISFSGIPKNRVLWVKTILPRSFISAVMPDNTESIMLHDLGEIF